MTNLDKYTKPSVAVDLAIMTVIDGDLHVLLVNRPEDDVAGWAMPGGFVHIDEAPEDSVERVLSEKVGAKPVHFEQLATYGALGRDPRGRVVSIVYLALCPPEVLRDADLAKVVIDWEGEIGGPAVAQMNGARLPLAFDHAAILGDVVKRLRGKLDYSPIAFALLPDRFTLREVQEVHEAILGKPLNKPPFRRKLLDRGMIVPTGEFETGSAYRPAKLFEVKSKE
ncbi:8-oxo-dGTP diphosphatase [Aliiroseovarius halocynthiae]|uniref:NUDIX domain-containing protein n=1 Tax=Aliiroseovarius halocynthiae TaxID=985055 RepID=A0A545SW58_9RHOB|nr:NUDIX domain-containing protein [Aliiroseovarius halocynthiae]TQV69208.1 NUDIX domain-containing protein [Aliiroseovarius halocynthiae]SMR71974.1 8-oxo-dGTP diphosphatase [Aliiroseovarius halocynthiae]